MKNRLEKSSFQFEYFSSNYEKFEEDFYRYANLNVPLTFLTDDIIRLMVSTNNNYFRLNAANSKDGRDHYFVFKKLPLKDNREVSHFKYLGHKYKLKLN